MKSSLSTFLIACRGWRCRNPTSRYTFQSRDFSDRSKFRPDNYGFSNRSPSRTEERQETDFDDGMKFSDFEFNFQDQLAGLANQVQIKIDSLLEFLMYNSKPRIKEFNNTFYLLSCLTIFGTQSNYFSNLKVNEPDNKPIECLVECCITSFF